MGDFGGEPAKWVVDLASLAGACWLCCGTVWGGGIRAAAAAAAAAVVFDKSAPSYELSSSEVRLEIIASEAMLESPAAVSPRSDLDTGDVAKVGAVSPSGKLPKDATEIILNRF